jgi:succinoglycan biosynthesis protein ExoV
MHGAIIADALRIPWVPISAFNSRHEKDTHSFKWADWCGSVDVEFEPLRLPPFRPHGYRYLLERLTTPRLEEHVAETIIRYCKAGRSFMSSDFILDSRVSRMEDEVARLAA